MNYHSSSDFRQELLSPYLNRLDQEMLQRSVWEYIEDSPEIPFPTIPLEPNFRHKDFIKSDHKKILLRAVLPGYLIADIFNLYFTKLNQLTFNSIDLTNQDRFHLLSGLNDFSIKILTNGSMLNSWIYTREVCKAIVYAVFQTMDVFQIISYVKIMFGKDLSLPGLDKSMKGIPLEDKFPKLFKSIFASDFNFFISEAKNIASRYINETSDISPDLNRINLDSDFSRLKEISIYIRYRKIISNLLSQSSGISSMITDTFKAGINFMQSHVYSEEPIFEAQYFSSFSRVEYLHPSLNGVLLEYAAASGYKPKLLSQFNFYIDVSGSMKSFFKININNSRYITFLDFAKAVVMKFKDNDMVKSIHPFDTQVSRCEVPVNDYNILRLCAGGQTDINAAIIHHILNYENPSIIITDAQCVISSYSESVLIIGIPQSSFCLIDEAKKFKDSGQILVFNEEGELNEWI